MRLKYVLLILAMLLSVVAFAKHHTFDVVEFAHLRANSNDTYDNSARLDAALQRIRHMVHEGDEITLRFPRGRYDFYASDARRYDLYISNHDNPAQRAVVFMLKGWKNLNIEGEGSQFVFHGRLIPFYLAENSKSRLRNFSIDFADPQIAQVEIVANKGGEGISFRLPPTYNYHLSDDGDFSVSGLDWTAQYPTGIAFDPKTRHIVYNTADLGIDLRNTQQVGDRTFHSPNWRDQRLDVGVRVALRNYERPCPGIVLDHCNDTKIEKVSVHYAEGMGLVAQRCKNIILRKFAVRLRGEKDERYFTTQADATHFSQCSGEITSEGGCYEGMMDDAINIHGIYLKVQEIRDGNWLRASYEHYQAFGFAWGDVGDELRFIKTATMEHFGEGYKIRSIRPADQDRIEGCKSFWIELNQPLPANFEQMGSVGIENLTWTPTVRFANNIVRNNRARGALFSSPRRTVCENNLFDHTSGTAILLCGDCNGWYESGNVTSLSIRHNTFVNALTSMFQFTNAVISIYPEIPQLGAQRSYFHGGAPEAIVIENNKFETFDAPILYAKSVDGLVFRHNKIKRNHDFAPFHWNQKPVLLERVTNAQIEEAR